MAARPKASLRPGQGGEPAVLELERPLAASLTPGQPLVAHFHSSEGVVLLREPAALGGFFAGSLSSLSVEEVLGHVVSGMDVVDKIKQVKTAARGMQDVPVTPVILKKATLEQ